MTALCCVEKAYVFVCLSTIQTLTSQKNIVTRRFSFRVTVRLSGLVTIATKSARQE